MNESALNDSLARLDAALGVTSTRPLTRTPLQLKGQSRRFSAAGVTSVLEGRGLDSSITNTESPFANLSGIGESILGNASIFGDEVTAPLPDMTAAMADQTVDDTTVALQQLPAQHNAQVLFSEFVRVLVGEHTKVTDEDSGIWGEVHQYELLCQQQITSIQKVMRRLPRHHASSKRIQFVLERLFGEHKMWQLLRSLYRDRQCRSDSPDALQHPNDTMSSWLQSDQSVVSQLFDSSREIREAQLVVDWLEKSASEELQQTPEKVEYYGDSHVAWENTLRVVKASTRAHGQGMGRLGGGAEVSKLVSSLDPDAPVRQKKALHDLDQEDERVLARHLMLCLRAGEMHEAQEKCLGSGQHWRAAALEGWKLHHDPNITDPTKRTAIQGNPYRDLWKSVAWQASEDPRLSQHQRALYGTLCGNLPAMLLVCQDWEDLLWAHLKVLVDQRVEETLRMSHANGHMRSLVPLPQKYPEQRMTMKSVFSSIEKCCSEAELKNPYFLICKHLILDDMDGLVNSVQLWLREGPAPHLLRCLTHLLLVLRRGCVIVESSHMDTVNDVLHACVKSAVERGDVEQVAWYTAMLPATQQVGSYASFLTNINDPPQRSHALHLAATVGLDTHAIAATTTAIIRLSPSGSAMTDSDVSVGDTVQSDRIKISGLDWVLFDESLRQEALIQGLALIRGFLIARKLAAANMTMDKIPGDTLSMVAGDEQDDVAHEVEAAVREYLCIKTFLSAQECFSEWFEHYHQQRPTAPSSLPAGSTFSEQIAHDHATLQYEGCLAKWQSTLDKLTKVAKERLYNVLLFPDGGWLVDLTALPHSDQSQHEDEAGRLPYLSPELAAREPSREHQLATLRSIYIPQVCSLLQSILSSTKQHKECLQLADIVASEQHQLYTAFGNTELQRFLHKMIDSSRFLLDNDKDALGYPLH